MIIYLNNLEPKMDQKQQKDFGRQVMRRIWFVFYARKIFQPVVLEVLGLLAVFLSIKSMVSLGNIVQNLIQSEDVFAYTETAILETEFAVQAGLVIGFTLCFLLFKRTLKSLTLTNFTENKV
jgi:hypothetical protein